MCSAVASHGVEQLSQPAPIQGGVEAALTTPGCKSRAQRPSKPPLRARGRSRRHSTAVALVSWFSRSGVQCDDRHVWWGARAACGAERTGGVAGCSDMSESCESDDYRVWHGGSRIRKWAPCSTSGPSDYRAEESNNLKGKVKVERQLVGLPWAADGCPWVGKLRTMLPFYH
jgi:hypothetical protein